MRNRKKKLSTAIMSVLVINPISLMVCSDAIASPITANFSDSSRAHIENIFRRLSFTNAIAQEEDYSEFVVNGFGEDQWDEITPDFSDMFPDGGDELTPRENRFRNDSRPSFSPEKSPIRNDSDIRRSLPERGVLGGQRSDAEFPKLINTKPIVTTAFSPESIDAIFSRLTSKN